jgi:hypothetical protein
MIMKPRIGTDPNLKLVNLESKPQVSLIKKSKPELSYTLIR